VGDTTKAPPAMLIYANRPIFQFRTSVLGRTPADRAAAVRQVLDRLVDGGAIARVEILPMGSVTTIAVGGFNIFAIVPADIDGLAGETMAESAAQAASRLQVALDEVVEARRPRQLLFSVLQFLIATIVFVAIAWALARARRNAGRRLETSAKRRLQATAVGGEAEFVRSSRIMDFLHHFITFVAWAIVIFVAYWWLTFSLRRFPYTRFWGESLRGFLLGHLSLVGTAILGALPSLFTVLIIVLLTRFVERIVHLFFQAVEESRITVPWIYPETAQPTRKVIAVGLWLFAVAIAYPYLPGSESDAFKGVSVFVGLMVSLGATGLVNQVMSGPTPARCGLGDFVEVWDVAGTVTQMGTLSTKIRTPRNEDVTIPNAVIVGQTITNYSRRAETEGVFVPTDITIATTWRGGRWKRCCSSRRVVPRDHWYAAPAKRDGHTVSSPKTASGASARSHEPRGA
jgi:small-conductance mechanosensitive channel